MGQKSRMAEIAKNRRPAPAAAQPPTEKPRPKRVRPTDVPELIKTVERGLLMLKSGAAGFASLQQAIEAAAAVNSPDGPPADAGPMSVPVFNWTARFGDEAVAVRLDLSHLNPEEILPVLQPMTFLLSAQLQSATKIIETANQHLQLILAQALHREDDVPATDAQPDPDASTDDDDLEPSQEDGEEPEPVQD